MEIKFYQNKKNPHKYLEVHYDGFGHRTWRQIINNKVRNYVGDGNLHRVSKGTLDEVLADYKLTWFTYLTASCTYCGYTKKYPIFGEEYDGLCKYLEGLDGFRSSAGMIHDLVPTVPSWIRAGAIKHEMCTCPKCNPFK